MAMTTCKDCNEPVSSRADECRHCGRWMLWGRLDDLLGLPLLCVVLIVFFEFYH